MPAYLPRTSRKGPAPIDRTGFRRGRLTVVSLDRRDGKMSWWLCRCDCGKEKIINAVHFTAGKTRSCGCLHRERIRHPRPNYKRCSDGESALRFVKSMYGCSARKRGYEFSLSDDDIIRLVSGDCFYCGAKPGRNTRRTLHRSIIRTDVKINGIDRVNSDLGYTSDNVVSCCRTCNFAKNNMPVEEFMRWVQAVYEHSRQAGKL